MRIAQVAPLYERVPPERYGGAERVVHALTEALVRRGHDVTLFATADSITSARLESMASGPLRLVDPEAGAAAHLRMLREVFDRSREFDIIHAHVGHCAYPFAQESRTPVIHTIHGRLDAPDHQAKLRRYDRLRLVSVSRSQRNPVRHIPVNWAGTVYNGLNLSHFDFRAEPDPEPYLAFLGRISPDKGPDRAIEIARQAGMTLKIAAKIDPRLDAGWARSHFLPLIDQPGVEFLGEIGEPEKSRLLGGARALLFPVRWAEPFGLAMVEAMACGTPVIASSGGAISEVMSDGETGYVCRSLDEMVDAIGYLDKIDRHRCRSLVARRFSAEAMTDRYEAVYRHVVTQASKFDMAVLDGQHYAGDVPPDVD